MKVRMNDLTALHNTIDELIYTLDKVVERSAFIGGYYVDKFQEDFAEYMGVDKDNVVLCGNGTDALELALQDATGGVQTSVACPALTFAATAGAIVRTGNIPVFHDVEEDGLLGEVEAEYIVNVHLWGQNNTKVYSDCVVIDDCAQAHGHKDFMGGYQTFSFFPGKNLGAWGDAGAVICRNPNRMRYMANHGKVSKHDHQWVGRNSRMDGIQAAVLSVKLKYLDVWNERRKHIAEIYDRNIECEKMVQIDSVYHQYVLKHEDRGRVMRLLGEAGIETAIHYPSPLTKQMAFREWARECPTAEHLCESIFSIPIHPMMEDEQVEYVIDNVNKIIKN